MNDSEYWARYPAHHAIQIVKKGFGTSYIKAEKCRNSETDHHFISVYVLDFVVGDFDVVQHELEIRAELDWIDWQMIVRYLLDKSRFRTVRNDSVQPCNIYAIAPISLIQPRPVKAYHATEKGNVPNGTSRSPNSCS